MLPEPILRQQYVALFAGASPLEDLALVVREAGVAKAIQVPDLDLAKIAEQLGVEPSDQITGYSACVFVEGPSDIDYLTTVAQKLGDVARIPTTFEDRNIGFVLCGGETLKSWIDRWAMGRLNRRFGVIIDIDRTAPTANIAPKKTKLEARMRISGRNVLHS